MTQSTTSTNPETTPGQHSDRIRRQLRAREERQRREALGLCMRCGGSRDGPYRNCGPCRLKKHASGKASTKAAVVRRRVQGSCLRCGAPREHGRQVCDSCASKATVRGQRYYRRLRQEGICTACHARQVIPPRKTCEECRRAAREARLRRAAAGLCVACKSSQKAEVQNHSSLCLNCWFRGAARQHLGTRTGGAVLRQIFENQAGRCAYTGEPLTPGVNASLDHKTPITRGGSSDEQNLQWVTKKVNWMKGDMTHEEFLAACALITQRHPPR